MTWGHTLGYRARALALWQNRGPRRSAGPATRRRLTESAILDTADLARSGRSPAIAVRPAGRLARLALQSPALRVTIALLLFALCWLAVLDATSLAPPVDNIEQLVWLHSLAWGYAKHPPLPTWVAWAATSLFGASAWTTYALGAATTLGSLAIMWRMLREMRGSRHATIALLAALCITFYNGRLYYYNHNVVLMALVAASAACCWRAFDEHRLRWWVALGAALGLGALTKYQIAVTVVSLVCFWAWQRGWRDPVHRRGILLAALVALAIVTPHVWWLRGHDFEPIGYAMHSSLGAELAPHERLFGAANWLLDALLNRALPALLLLAVALRSGARFTAFSPAEAAHDARWRTSRALLVCWGVVPLLFMPLMALATGAELQMQWSTAFLPFLVPCVMELRPARRWQAVPERVVWTTFLLLQALLLAVNIATSPLGVRSLMDSHWRTFSAARLAARIVPAARRELGGTVPVIIGPVAEAGSLSLELPEHPLVLIDGDYERSPWVDPALVANCGALQLIHSPEPVASAAPVGAPFAELYWRVVPPAAGAPACVGRRAGD